MKPKIHVPVQQSTQSTMRANIIFTACIFYVLAGFLKTELKAKSLQPTKRDVSYNGGRFVAEYVELIGNTVYRFVPDEPAPAAMSESPESQLKKIRERLNPYLVGWCFDFEKFEKEADNIELQLTSLKEAVLKQTPNNGNSLSLLDFTRRIFNEMADTIELLRRYSGREDLDLVNSMIGLNVKLFSMYDFEGKPDSGAQGFEDSVRRYSITMDFWNDRFQELEGVPIGVRLEFKRQLTRAQNTLAGLRSSIQNKKKKKKN